VPVFVYPINGLWTLAPVDRLFDQRVKRDRLPSPALLLTAAPWLELVYQHYSSSTVLGDALRQDVSAGFTRAGIAADPPVITGVVIFLDRTAEARNLARFS
jgi:hypothetical protein